MRTDRLHLCERCLHRQPKARACARCGREALADLTTSRGREAVRWRLERRAEEDASAQRDPTRGKDPVSKTVWILRLALAGVSVVYPLCGAPATIGLVALAGALLVFNALRSKEGPSADPNEPPPRSEPAPSAVSGGEAGGAFTRVVGRVRSVKLVSGPASGLPCAAARVVGATAGGEVDDALCGEFELLDGRGEVVARVRGGVARVDVATEPPVVIAPLPEAASAFLDARLLFRADGRATLGEGRVAEGDLVACEGPGRAQSEPSSATYRENRLVMEYRGTSEHPLLVRRVDA